MINILVSTQKQADYLLFKQAFNLFINKEHLTMDGLSKIASIKNSMNLGLSDALKVAFPNIVLVVRPLVENQSILNPQWIAGFTSGDGCFMIKILNSSNNKINQVLLVFQITQHVRYEQLIRSFIKYFNCGKIYKIQDVYDLRVTKYSYLTDKIIPFFQKYPVQGVKLLDFLYFVKVAELIKNKAHLTTSGLEKIRKIKAGMNRGRTV